jgi:hypothetical protein
LRTWGYEDVSQKKPIEKEIHYIPARYRRRQRKRFLPHQCITQ